MRRPCNPYQAVFVVIITGVLCGHASADAAKERIRPWADNPRYWQYRGQPVLLVGGSVDDNLFQLPELEAHLDEMAAVGANYVRCTMSDRPDKGFEVYPFRKLPDGKYDLDEWNDEYWTRFEKFLRETHRREIFVQIELWDRFDYADSNSQNWTLHPYNPQNNVNYTHEESGLKATYRQHPGSNENPFFRTVPALENNAVVLKYQEAQIDKLLSIALQYPHVLYCIDNETGASPEWPIYWSDRLRRRAREAGVEIHVTEMWDDWNPKGPQHRNTFDHPDRYSFVDISQNNHNRGQAHWDNFHWVRDYLATRPRPINTVKIYGADTGRYGGSRDGEERFWRNLFAGAAATRFHRPDSGLGLNDRAKTQIKSFRRLAAEFDFFGAQPDVASRRLRDREPNEAYLTVHGDGHCAVYFPDGGKVGLDLSHSRGTHQLRWLDVAHARFGESTEISGGRIAPLECPGNGHWVALITIAP